MEWRDRVGPLKVGDRVTQSAKMVKAVYKKGMVFVHHQRDIYPSYMGATQGGDDWAIREIRTHVFRPDEEIGSKEGKEVCSERHESIHLTRHLASVPNASVADVGDTRFDVKFTYLPTSPLLFRYSALTFNAHKVHYDRPWTQTMEGHPDLLVHGPLTATLLIELACQTGKQLIRFEYRAVKPLYVDQEILLAGRWSERKSEGRLDLWAEQEGRVGMRATAWMT